MADNDPKHTSIAAREFLECQLVAYSCRVSRHESHRESLARDEGVREMRGQAKDQGRTGKWDRGILENG